MKIKELPLTIISIIGYIFLNSFCLNKFGSTSYITFICNLVITLILLLIISKTKTKEYYGLIKPKEYVRFMYFVPLFIIIFLNFIGGIQINNTVIEIIFFMLSMLLIGFIEEIIFRGFLFKMMEKDNLKTAMIVSSLTFGIGHIVNLFNGSNLIPTLIQIIYSVIVGYLFVLIFHKSKSLLPCIITHSLINALSIFQTSSPISSYISPILLIIISLWYIFVITNFNKLFYNLNCNYIKKDYKTIAKHLKKK